jgi:pimeloyl-ACP methyl ester carboxylesterase
MATVTTGDGVELAYEVHGVDDVAALTVVFVHGWAANRTYWDHQVSFLSDRYRVITLDLAGHGESGEGRSDWNLPAFGDDVVTVVDAVGADRVALVGHSMGGDAAVFAAQRLRDRVAGIVWVDVLRSLGDEPVSPPDVVEGFVAPFREDFDAATDRFARGLFPPTADPALVDRVTADMAAARREGTLGSLGRALNRHPPIIAALAEISAPVVAINPDLGPTNADSLRRHGVQPTVLGGVGHYLMLEDPARFNAVLASALASFNGHVPIEGAPSS